MQLDVMKSQQLVEEDEAALKGHEIVIAVEVRDHRVDERRELMVDLLQWVPSLPEDDEWRSQFIKSLLVGLTLPFDVECDQLIVAFVQIRIEEQSSSSFHIEPNHSLVGEVSFASHYVRLSATRWL